MYRTTCDIEILGFQNSGFSTLLTVSVRPGVEGFTAHRIFRIIFLIMYEYKPKGVLKHSTKLDFCQINTK